MRILSFDQSSRLSGYALFDGIDLVRWGYLDCPEAKDSEARVNEMIGKLCTVITKIKPHLVIFEDVQLQGSPKTLIMLSRIQGAIMGCCVENNIPYTLYLPTQWRRIAGFKQGPDHKRDDLKKQAIAFVREAYQINIGEDCAESIVIGLAYLKEHNQLPDLENLKRSRKQNHSEYREEK